MTATRSIRLFLSSTFRDFGEERDLLVRQVFPARRARLKDRFVELVPSAKRDDLDALMPWNFGK